MLIGLGIAGLASPATTRAAGDANQPGCPVTTEGSPGFRAYLPDCRAYEMVTPPYKEGYPVHFNGLTPSGDGLFGSSLASLSDTEGAPQSRGSIGAEYEFRRGASGWSPVAVTPPNPEFRGAVTFEGVAPDGAASLFKLPAPPIGNDHFYLRQADGSLVDVGPATPPVDGPVEEPAPEGVPAGAAHFAGASLDMSHVIFSLSAPWGWPGDSTLFGGLNLYEYAGTGNTEPTMVAVRGGPNSTELLSRCGETLGGPQFSSAFDAVSASGNVIAFTPLPADELPCFDATQPAHAELYVRVNDERTVDISGRQCDPNECPQSSPSAAVFEGASRDGRRGWFLSTEQLTTDAVDDAEPGDSASGFAGSGCQGAQGSGCNLYEYDLSRPAGELLRAVSLGSPRPHVQGMVRISADGSHVYFVATGALAAQPGPGGREPVEGANNLYVCESLVGGGTRLRFIATLAEGDQELWGGSYGSDEGRPASASADGATMLFVSRADLTPDDSSDGVPQLFLYRDGARPTLQRVSVAQGALESGSNSDEFAATISSPDYQGAEAFRPQALPLNLRGDVAVFESAASLTPGAGPPGGTGKLYEYREGGVYLIEPNPDGSARLRGLSTSGRDVFFETDGALVPSDGDTQGDIYDARSEGGFPEASAVNPCTGEACLGPLAGVESPARPGTLDFVGSGPRGRGSLRRALHACRHKRGRRARRRCERAVKGRHSRGGRR